jgi:dipeptidyl aminopeptidase/acylaminoacyl peptidase
MLNVQMLRLSLLVLIGLGTAAAQTKLPATPAEYGQWETIINNPRGHALSPDGKWLAYAIDRSNGNNELRVTNVASGATKTIAFGAQPAFSEDSLWMACSIGDSEAHRDKLRKDKKPIQDKLGLMNLGTGEQTVVDEIESFAFSPTGKFLAMRRYAPEKKDAPTPPSALEDEPATVGATLIVRQLASGQDLTFGSVAEFLWQNTRVKGHLLAMLLNVAGTTPNERAGNGVQLFDSETGALRVLDSAPTTYSGLAWRKDSADLTFLRAKTDDKHQGATNIAVAFTHLNEPGEASRRFDPTSADSKFPAGMRTVTYRKPLWSDDGQTVFFGIAVWPEKPPVAKPTAKDKDKEDEDEPASVDIWHWRDLDVMPKQKIGARRDFERSLVAAWHVDSGAFVQLGQGITEQVTPIRHQPLAWAADWKNYAMDRTIGRPTADIYLLDLATGDRTKVHEHLYEDRYVEASPQGRYLLFVENDQYWTVNTATRAVVNITKNVKTSFVDRESDFTIKQKPAFGVAGWTKDDAAVLLYDKFDVWEITPDGTHAIRLTDGAEHEVRHRYVRLDPEEEFIDTSKPIYLSLFGIWTKQSGYARLDAGAKQDQHLLCLDKYVGRLMKARNADVFAYTSETFEESPNFYITANADWTNTKQVTKTNEFQNKYAWSHSELVEYKNSRGERLQGALYYPAGYEAGRKYPMVVYLYEKLSDNLHHYASLSERQYYNANAFTSHGYFLLMPDIVFRAREPGVSVADCVSAAVKKVLQKGVIDERKIGVIGHSWGGFDTTFLATHTNIFAAAVAGAPITDLVSNYGNHHWSSGIAETDHIETGQQRMEVPLWEDLPAYIRNSAVFNVQNMTTPLLIEVGDSDGTVFFHQGVELYNIARRAKKEVVLIEYAGEDHPLRKKPDQIDYQRRIFAWFGHYLKGEPAPGWISDGESYLDRQREVQKLKPAKAEP